MLIFQFERQMSVVCTVLCWVVQFGGNFPEFDVTSYRLGIIFSLGIYKRNGVF